VASSDFVVTCETFRDAQPHLQQTRKRGRDILLPLLEEGIVPVVTGFIGATPDGRITTLGRNSSDFSGAIIAHVVDADELVIWTDVDGIYTANPHESAEARLLHELSYDEAHTLAASAACQSASARSGVGDGCVGKEYVQSRGARHPHRARG
jgi:aspartate kinase